VAKPWNVLLAAEFEALHIRPRGGRALIVGSKLYPTREDRRQRYVEAVGLDMLAGDGVDVVHDLEEAPPESLGRFMHVECRSVLEHSRRPWLLAAHIEDLMMPGATLDLSVPFIWGLHAYPSDLFRFTDAGVRELFPRIDWRHLCYASDHLAAGEKTARRDIDDHIWLPRTEVLGFGVRRP
jgi:hypothetical protein